MQDAAVLSSAHTPQACKRVTLLPTMSLEKSGFLSSPTVHINTANKDPTANCTATEALKAVVFSSCSGWAAAADHCRPYLDRCAGDGIWEDFQDLLIVSAQTSRLRRHRKCKTHDV